MPGRSLQRATYKIPKPSEGRHLLLLHGVTKALQHGRHNDAQESDDSEPPPKDKSGKQEKAPEDEHGHRKYVDNQIRDILVHGRSLSPGPSKQLSKGHGISILSSGSCHARNLHPGCLPFELSGTKVQAARKRREQRGEGRAALG